MTKRTSVFLPFFFFFFVNGNGRMYILLLKEARVFLFQNYDRSTASRSKCGPLEHEERLCCVEHKMTQILFLLVSHHITQEKSSGYWAWTLRVYIQAHRGPMAWYINHKSFYPPLLCSKPTGRFIFLRIFFFIR